MPHPTTHRYLGTLGVLTVLGAGVPLTTTFLLSEWLQIERVLLVAFLPFFVNGLIGMALMAWTARRQTDPPERVSDPTDVG